jgi:hypothetical protein
MLVEDTTAFIEQLEVVRRDRRAEKRGRRRRQVELEALRAEWEARVAAEALRKMEQELAALVSSSPERGAVRRALAARRQRVLERRIGAVRTRLDSKRADVMLSRERLRGLDQTQRRGRSAPGARVFRLHSARHHLECSERRFTRLAGSQSDLPVLVAKHDGRSWWWYRDRFWWDDEGLDAYAVKVSVLDGELRSRQHAEALAQARAAVLGEEPRAGNSPGLSQIVRFAVWCRDRGRCVDCGTADDLGFDEILSTTVGGSTAAANVELRCVACHERRVHNEERARVGRAQVDAVGLGA